MNILFICRYNRFRSKIAEAYFNKINKNKNINAKSAGIFIGSYPLDKTEIKVAKELGIILKGRPKGISTKLLRWKDLIIAVTDDLPKGLFNFGPYKSKIINWKIEDNYNGKEKSVKNIITRIMKRSEELVKKLEKQK